MPFAVQDRAGVFLRSAEEFKFTREAVRTWCHCVAQFRRIDDVAELFFLCVPSCWLTLCQLLVGARKAAREEGGEGPRRLS